MQVRKQQLELDMEQQTGSILKDDAVESAALNMQYAICTQYAICRLPAAEQPNTALKIYHLSFGLYFHLMRLFYS